MQIYAACNLTYGIYIDLPCIQTCLQSCEQWSYNIELVQFGVTPPKDDKITGSISFSVSSFEYPIFKEQYTWTLQNFVGALGGVLGLFLGLHGIKLVKVLLSFLAILSKAVMAVIHMKKTEPDGTEMIATKTIVVVPK